MLLSQLPIRAKLAVMIGPTLALLLIVSVAVLIELNQSVGKNEKILRLSQLSIHSNALVHELQKERGMTAGFLASQGTSFSTELKAQRAQVSQLEKRWQNFRSQNQTSLEKAGTSQKTSDIQRRLALRGEIQSKVDRLSIPLKDALNYYTTLNAELLSIATDIAKSAVSPELSLQIAAYDQFLQGKERAGIERAVLNTAFAADRFSPGLFSRFVRLVAEQTTYMSSFNKLATADVKRAFETVYKDPSFKGVEQFRKIAEENNASGGFNVSPSEWFSTASARINQLKAMEDQLTKTLIKTAESELSKAKNNTLLFALLLGVAVCLSLTMSYVIWRGIDRQLKDLLSCIERVTSQGNLQQRCKISCNDEVGQTAIALNTMLDSMQKLVKAIDKAGYDISKTSQQVAATILQSHENFNHQKNETTQMAAAFNELTATAQEVASNTQLAAEAVNDVNDTTQASRQVVDHAVEAIEELSGEVGEVGNIVAEINQNSEAISGVLDVIKSVAEQTNLLALNAAIEAARAGEQGKGFAVVADEVRSLAQRSQASASEIEIIVEKFQHDTGAAQRVINSGQNSAVKSVNEARSIVDNLERINEGVITIQKMTIQIASATEQQVAVNNEVNRSINAVDDMSQENIAGLTDISKSAQNQIHLADDLNSQIRQFKA